MSLFSNAGVEFLLRWMHVLAGITWIGLLYYFNFVQGPFFAEADAATKSAATAARARRGGCPPAATVGFSAPVGGEGSTSMLMLRRTPVASEKVPGRHLGMIQPRGSLYPAFHASPSGRPRPHRSVSDPRYRG